MSAGRKITRDRQRGAALLLVLWTALLLSVVLAGALAAVRIEAKIAAARRQMMEADLAISSALDLAAWKIAAGEAAPGDKLVEEFTLNGFSVTIENSIEGEKLDVNRANETVFAEVFRAIGIETELADRLAAEIADWRDEDDLPRPNGAEKSDYANAAAKRIGDRPFSGYGELRDVLHMTPEIYDCLAPALTIFGSGAAPTARVMALIGLPPLPGEAPRAAARLGTSVRGATAGGVHAIEATAIRKGSMLAPRKLVRIFRVVGAPKTPFEEIAEFRPRQADAVNCEFGNERGR
jgi:general secretion pathway protein K